MTWPEKIDAVIDCLYQRSGDNPTFSLIEERLKSKGVEKGEIRDILLYLYRREFIYCEVEGDRDHAYSDLGEAHYLINAKGKLFKEANGFAGESRSETRKERQEKLQIQFNRWVTIATVITMLLGIWQVFGEQIEGILRTYTQKEQKVIDQNPPSNLKR
jgi:hypothetical protein